MQTVLFSSPLIEIGRWQLHADSRRFAEAGYVEQPLMVFPRNPIWIKHEYSEAFVADTSVINFYNRDQVYRRDVIHPQGDDCHNFSLREDLLCELMGRPFGKAQLFSFEKLSCNSLAFELQLKILQALQSPHRKDRLQIEELTLQLFAVALEGRSHSGAVHKQAAASKNKGARELRLIESVKCQLQERLDENLSLQEIADAHHVSPCHLSRLFSRHAGLGLSRYRNDQRLREASFRVLQGDALTSVALDCGFSSHSHLSASFKRYFGCTPSEFRCRQTRH